MIGRRILVAASLVVLIVSLSPRATVPSVEKPFGSISTRGAAPQRSMTWSTDWFCSPSFLLKK